jgi:hypothetical protein
LTLAEQLQAVHPRHVDVGEDREQLRFDLIGKELQSLISRVGEVQHIGALPRLPSETLAKQLGDIGLIINHEDADNHAYFPAGAAA